MKEKNITVTIPMEEYKRLEAIGEAFLNKKTCAVKSWILSDYETKFYTDNEVIHKLTEQLKLKDDEHKKLSTRAQEIEDKYNEINKRYWALLVVRDTLKQEVKLLKEASTHTLKKLRESHTSSWGSKFNAKLKKVWKKL
jgi:hypothetical protein